MLVKDHNKTTISNGEDSFSLLFQTAVSTNDIDQWFSSFSIHQNHLGGLVRHRLLGPAWKCSRQARGPRIHIATKFSDDANTGLETIYISNSAIKSSLPQEFIFSDTMGKIISLSQRLQIQNQNKLELLAAIFPESYLSQKTEAKENS